jgi:hypothetical protein
MYPCVRPGCTRPGLADWWQFCVECSLPLLVLDDVAEPVPDRLMAAGWDALGWAERIAPDHWGSAADADSWVVSVRCLTLAAVVTGRSSGCPHTVGPGLTVPVVAVVRAPGVFRCPPCAEPLVAQWTAGGVCDRCAAVPVGETDRVAVLAGAALIVVGLLCGSCRSRVFELLDGVEQA